MPISGSDFDQCYNAQCSVDIEKVLIVGQHLSQHPNDKQELKLAFEILTALPEALGTVDGLLADAGYFSAQPMSITAWRRRSSPLSAQAATHITKISKNVLPNLNHYLKVLILSRK